MLQNLDFQGLQSENMVHFSLHKQKRKHVKYNYIETQFMLIYTTVLYSTMLGDPQSYKLKNRMSDNLQYIVDKSTVLKYLINSSENKYIHKADNYLFLFLIVDKTTNCKHLTVHNQDLFVSVYNLYSVFMQIFQRPSLSSWQGVRCCKY